MILVREFDERDAEAVSRLIRDNLIEVNSRDYDGKVIDYMYDLFSPAYLRKIARERAVLVAEVNGRVLGVVSLNGDEICTLYVSPEAHGQRIGERLLHEIEDVALSRHLHVVYLSASLTAVRFYEKMGYVSFEREESEYFGPAWIMNKSL